MTITKPAPLDTLISARVRLTYDERNALKDAYRAAKSAELSEHPAPVGGSPIKVMSANLTGTQLDTELGMSQLVMTDLLTSRDSINLPVILHIQKVLGVEIITEKRILEACKGYIKYVFNS
jgi:hypothetical protein